MAVTPTITGTVTHSVHQQYMLNISYDSHANNTCFVEPLCSLNNIMHLSHSNGSNANTTLVLLTILFTKKITYVILMAPKPTKHDTVNHCVHWTLSFLQF